MLHNLIFIVWHDLFLKLKLCAVSCARLYFDVKVACNARTRCKRDKNGLYKLMLFYGVLCGTFSYCLIIKMHFYDSLDLLFLKVQISRCIRFEYSFAARYSNIKFGVIFCSLKTITLFLLFFLEIWPAIIVYFWHTFICKLNQNHT